MNLGDLRDELRHGILHDRSDQIAGDNPDYLWSDRRLIGYINEAQRKFARESLIIRDGTTTDCCRLQLVPFQRDYALHQSVVAVISARQYGDHVDLARAGHAQFSTYHTPNTNFMNPGEFSYVNPGKVVAFGTDEEVTQDDDGSMSTMVFRAFPAPDPIHAGVIMLRVIREPLNDLVNDNDVPEIPRDHHMDMLDWAASLALRIVDHELGDPVRAAEFAAKFELTVTKARNEVMRKLFTPSQWGFGRNGFTYDQEYQ